MKNNIIIAAIVILLAYSIVGTSNHVEEIKQKAPQAISERGWEIIRYEGFQYGSWGNHGGKVWYHVQNSENHNVQYRIYITQWNGELQFVYNKPEPLSRIELKYEK